MHGALSVSSSAKKRLFLKERERESERGFTTGHLELGVCAGSPVVLVHVARALFTAWWVFSHACTWKYVVLDSRFLFRFSLQSSVFTQTSDIRHSDGKYGR